MDNIWHVDDVRTVLGKAGLQLKFTKGYFFRRRMNYVGHRITPWRLKADFKLMDGSIPKDGNPSAKLLANMQRLPAVRENRGSVE